MDRVTKNQVHVSLHEFCNLVDIPHGDGSAEGLFLAGAYGGWRVERMTPGGGSMPVFSEGFNPLRHVRTEIQAACKTIRLLRNPAWLRTRADEMERENARLESMRRRNDANKGL